MNTFPKILMATVVALVSSSTHAEGIALGNPLAGSGLAALFAIFVLPVLVSGGLLVGMLATKGMRWALLAAVSFCAVFAIFLSLTKDQGLWLILLLLSPWVCLIIISASFLIGIRSNRPAKRAAGKP